MANIKSQKKRIKTNETARQRNRAMRSKVRTAIKNFESTLEGDDTEAAKEALRLASKQLDKAATNGAIHRNYASRYKSRLTKRLNA